MLTIYSNERVQRTVAEEAARLGVAKDAPEALQAAAERLVLPLELVEAATEEAACAA